MAVNQFEVGKRNAAKTQSLVRDKSDKISKPVKVASALMPSMPGFDGTLGPRGLDANRDAWAEALSSMSGVRTPDPLTAGAKVLGMGLAGYGAGKATRAKDEGTAAYKSKLAEALAGSPDNAALMGLMADPYADDASQRMLWNIYERNNPTQDEIQQRQMRDLQMQQTQQGMTAQQQQMEAARIQQEQQQQTWQQQQEEIQRQNAIRGGKMDAVEGFMQQQQAQGGDLFDPSMQAWLRSQGVEGVNPQDTRRYDAMQPYAQAGDYENAFQQMAAQPASADAPTVQKFREVDPLTGEPVEIAAQWINGQWQEIGRGPAFNPNAGVKVDNRQMGNVPPGYTVEYDEQDRPIRMVLIPGGPAAAEAEKAGDVADARQDKRMTMTDTVTGAADAARALGSEFGSTGIIGQGMSYWGQSDAAEVYRQVDVLKSTATIENLNAMRRESPTGGALGNVTEKEGAMLAAAAGALDPASGSERFQQQLDNYELTLMRVIHGYEAGTQMFEQRKAEQGQQAPQEAPPPGIDNLLKKYGG